MSYDLTSVGSKAQQDIRVENTGDRPMPVELFVERREILPDGSEKRTRRDDDFLIFPPQGVVPPNSFQTFRVRYIGDPAIAKSVLYLVTVSQLPVDAEGGTKSGVQFLFNLGTLAAVSPEGSVADLRVTQVKPAPDADNQLEITVHNEGNRYARLRNGTWTLIDGNGKREEVPAAALRAAIRQPLIEPDTDRVIRLPVSQGFARTNARAEFKPTPATGP